MCIQYQLRLTWLPQFTISIGQNMEVLVKESPCMSSLPLIRLDVMHDTNFASLISHRVTFTIIGQFIEHYDIIQM